MSLLLRFGLLCLCALIAGWAVPADAQDREAPYWATIRATVLNMRVGPSADYPVDWVYRQPGLPVRVLRLKEGWRLIEDPDGTQGWVVARLLSPERGAIVIGEGLAAMREEAVAGSELRWQLEPGVVGALGECEDGFCWFEVGDYRGWVAADRLWGDGDP